MTDDEARELVANKLSAITPHHDDSIHLEIPSIGIHLELCCGVINMEVRREVAISFLATLTESLGLSTEDFLIEKAFIGRDPKKRSDA